MIDFAQSLYFHREGEGLLIGMSNQEQKPGFDQNVDEEFEFVNLGSRNRTNAFAGTRQPRITLGGLV